MQTQPKLGYQFVKSMFGKYEEIPTEWNFESLGKFVEIISGDYFLYDEFVDSGIPVLKIDNVMYGRIDWQNKTFIPKKYLNDEKIIILKKGDIVLALNRPITNNQIKIASLDEADVPSALYQRVGKFQFKDERLIDKDFLFAFLRSYNFKRLVTRILVGSDQPYVKTTELLNQKFAIASNIHEQQKIGSIFLNIDSLIKRIQNTIEQTQKLKKSLLRKLLTKGIGHTKFKKITFGAYFIQEEVPESWKIVAVKNCSEKLVVGFVGTCEPYYTDNDGVSMLRTTNIKEGKLDLSNMKYVTQEFHENNKKSQIKEGDILVSRHGENGEACLVRNIKEANCMNIVIIRPKKDLFLPEFFEIAFNSSVVRRQIQRTTSGGVQGVVNTSEIGKVMIFIPDLNEQRKLVSVLGGISLQIQRQQEYKSALENLKKGLMQKLLTGQIRVKT